MIIKSIHVTGLFGLFNHVVPLQNADHVTIVHGPNGIGKTVLLRLIASFIEGKRGPFERTPFKEFRVTLEDGSSRIIERHSEAGTRGRLEFYVLDSEGNRLPFDENSLPVDVPQRFLEMVDKKVPAPYNLIGSHWVDDEEIAHSLSDILERFPDAIDALPKRYRPGPLFDISRELEVFFIETNRLDVITPRQTVRTASGTFHLGEHGESAKPRVEHNSKDLVRRIQAVTTVYAKRSEERDRTFPERLVRFVREGQVSLPERDILSRMTELENKRNRLVTLGLLDQESGLQNLAEEDVRRTAEALTIYVGDMDHKLEVFDDLARRIGSLVDILNNRFKYKKLTINRDRGFRIINDLEQSINPHDLSSGEQHELIVLYELLFRCPSKGLVLIDEPEISLHVGWQSRFLSDLIRILDLSGAYGIVATHSPVIVGSRSDLAVGLNGPTTVGEGADDAREY